MEVLLTKRSDRPNLVFFEERFPKLGSLKQCARHLPKVAHGGAKASSYTCLKDWASRVQTSTNRGNSKANTACNPCWFNVPPAKFTVHCRPYSGVSEECDD